jgi:aspartokinase
MGVKMVTVSHIVNKLVEEKVYLQEAIGKGVASYGSVAKRLKPDIEKELKREVAHYAIVAALRRYAERMDVRFKEIKFAADTSEVNLKTNIIDINVQKTMGLFDKLKRIYDIIKFDKGDNLHIIYGRNTVNIITNERYKKPISLFLQNEKILEIKENLVALAFTIDKDLVKTPGVLFQIARNFAWESINIIEIISIDLEIVFIVKEEDAVTGYKALQRLIVQ